MVALKHLSTSSGLIRKGGVVDALPHAEVDRLRTRGLISTGKQPAGAEIGRARMNAPPERKRNKGRQDEEAILDLNAEDCIS